MIKCPKCNKHKLDFTYPNNFYFCNCKAECLNCGWKYEDSADTYGEAYANVVEKIKELRSQKAMAKNIIRKIPNSV